MVDANPPRWLSVKETAALLRVSEKFLYRAISNGMISVHRFGGVWRIQRADVDQYVAAARRPAKRVRP